MLSYEEKKGEGCRETKKNRRMSVEAMKYLLDKLVQEDIEKKDNDDKRRKTIEMLRSGIIHQEVYRKQCEGEDKISDNERNEVEDK